MHFKTGQTLKFIFLYFLLFLAGDLLASLLFDLLFSFIKLPASWMYQLFRAAGALLFTCLFFWLYTKKALHLSMGDFGLLPLVKGWAAPCAILLPVFVAGVYLSIGKASAQSVPFGEMLGVIIASLLLALKAGITEELLFRGYLLTLIKERWGAAAAVLLPSILFGLVHMINLASVSPAGVLMLILSGSLVGVMFSLTAFLGGSLINSMLLHTVWNFVMVTNILHITTAQGAYGAPLFSILIPDSGFLLTGGDFGIEASVISLLGYAVVCGVILLAERKNFGRLFASGSHPLQSNEDR